MRKFLIASAIMVFGLVGVANAQGGCPRGYYYASDGQCYPTQSFTPPVYVEPGYVNPTIIIPGLGLGLGNRGREYREHHRDYNHRGGEHRGEHRGERHRDYR